MKRQDPRRLSVGKLPPEVMERYLFGMTGARSARVVVEPALGLDFGVVRLAKGTGRPRFLIVSSDPITGVRERAGWYAVNVSANDVATSGNRPEFMQSIILLPEDASRSTVRAVSSEMNETAKRLGISIVGGHTELSLGLRRPIVVTTAFALADAYVTAAGAREGDSVMMTKSAGVEGTAILATDEKYRRELERRTAEAAARYFERLSVVDEATLAYGTGAVHAMHDCTEGGVLGALYEMAAASAVGLEVDEERIPVSAETTRVCAVAGADPFKLISSGTLLLAVKRGEESAVRGAAEAAGSSATKIGMFGGKKAILRRGEATEELTTAPADEIWRLQREAGGPW